MFNRKDDLRASGSPPAGSQGERQLEKFLGSGCQVYGRRDDLRSSGAQRVGYIRGRHDLRDSENQAV